MQTTDRQELKSCAFSFMCSVCYSVASLEAVADYLGSFGQTTYSSWSPMYSEKPCNLQSIYIIACSESVAARALPQKQVTVGAPWGRMGSPICCGVPGGTQSQRE
jgi:hypothetical protein